jgi:hypothetical protein
MNTVVDVSSDTLFHKKEPISAADTFGDDLKTP